MKILVAEDNDSNYILIQYLIRGVELVRACNGQEAVDAMKTSSFDLVLMDIKMPVMDGLEAVRTIRTFDTTTPIIALTANAFDSDKVQALEAGCDSFVTKPVIKQILYDEMEKFVSFDN